MPAVPVRAYLCALGQQALNGWYDGHRSWYSAAKGLPLTLSLGGCSTTHIRASDEEEVVPHVCGRWIKTRATFLGPNG